MGDNLRRITARTGSIRSAVSSPLSVFRTALSQKDIRAVVRRPVGRHVDFNGVMSGAMLHAGTTIAKRVLVRGRWWHGERFRGTGLSS